MLLQLLDEGFFGLPGAPLLLQHQRLLLPSALDGASAGQLLLDAGLVRCLPLPFLLRRTHQAEDFLPLFDLRFQLGELGRFGSELRQLRPQGLPLTQAAVEQLQSGAFLSLFQQGFRLGVDGLLQLGLSLPLCGEQLFQGVQGAGQVPVPLGDGSFQLLPLGVVLRVLDVLQPLAQLLHGLLSGAPLGQFSLLQRFLELLAGFRLEQVPQDVPPHLTAGLQQRPKLPLRQHGHLFELDGGELEQCLDLLGHLTVAGGDKPLWAGQGGFPFLFGLAVALFALAQVFRTAIDSVLLLVVGEGEPDKGGGVRLGKVTAQGGSAPTLAAALAVEGKGDGIKEGGLAGAGIAGDEVESIGKGGKVHRLLSGVGAEGGKSQSNGFHVCSSASFRICSKSTRLSGSNARLLKKLRK